MQTMQNVSQKTTFPPQAKEKPEIIVLECAETS